MQMTASICCNVTRRYVGSIPHCDVQFPRVLVVLGGGGSGGGDGECGGGGSEAAVSIKQTFFGVSSDLASQLRASPPWISLQPLQEPIQTSRMDKAIVGHPKLI